MSIESTTATAYLNKIEADNKRAFEELDASRKAKEKDNIKEQQNLFAKMIVAQTSQMDPFAEKKDPADFLNQLIQMNAAEQATRQTSIIKEMKKTIDILIQINKAMLQGNDIKLKGNEILIQDDKARFEYTLPEDAKELQIFIQDENGFVVQRLPIQDKDYLKAGTHTVEWDGKGFDGKKLARDTIYKLKFNCTNLSNKGIAVSAASIANIKEIQLDGDARKIQIGKQSHSLENLIIMQKESKKDTTPSKKHGPIEKTIFNPTHAMKNKMIKHSPYI